MVFHPKVQSGPAISSLAVMGPAGLKSFLLPSSAGSFARKPTELECKDIYCIAMSDRNPWWRVLSDLHFARIEVLNMDGMGSCG